MTDAEVEASLEFASDSQLIDALRKRWGSFVFHGYRDTCIVRDEGQLGEVLHGPAGVCHGLATTLFYGTMALVKREEME